jgi:hypothetical protein
MNPQIEEKIFRQVVTSGILDPYREKDSSLDRLISEMTQAANVWKVHPDILVSTPEFHPASEVVGIYQRRLKTIPTETKYNETRDATKRLIDYCISNPNVNLCSITFNCSERHYTVFCGREIDEIVVICALTGGRIPKDVFNS